MKANASVRKLIRRRTIAAGLLLIAVVALELALGVYLAGRTGRNTARPAAEQASQPLNPGVADVFLAVR